MSNELYFDFAGESSLHMVNAYREKYDFLSIILIDHREIRGDRQPDERPQAISGSRKVVAQRLGELVPAANAENKAEGGVGPLFFEAFLILAHRLQPLDERSDLLLEIDLEIPLRAL